LHTDEQGLDGKRKPELGVKSVYPAPKYPQTGKVALLEYPKHYYSSHEIFSSSRQSDSPYPWNKAFEEI